MFWNREVDYNCQLSTTLGLNYSQKSNLTAYYFSGIESQNRPSLASLVATFG